MLEYMQALRHEYNVIGPANGFQNETVGIREAAVVYSSGPLANVSFDWTITASPRGKAGRWGVVGTNPFSILSSSRHKDAGFEFIKFWLSDEVQFYMGDNNIEAPQTISAAARREFLYKEAPPYDFSAFFFGTSRVPPLWAPNWSEIATRMSEGFLQVWNDPGVAPRNVLNQLDDVVNALLKQE